MAGASVGGAGGAGGAVVFMKPKADPGAEGGDATG